MPARPLLLKGTGQGEEALDTRYNSPNEESFKSEMLFDASWIQNAASEVGDHRDGAE